MKAFKTGTEAGSCSARTRATPIHSLFTPQPRLAHFSLTGPQSHGGHRSRKSSAATEAVLKRERQPGGSGAKQTSARMGGGGIIKDKMIAFSAVRRFSLILFSGVQKGAWAWGGATGYSEHKFDGFVAETDAPSYRLMAL